MTHHILIATFKAHVPPKYLFNCFISLHLDCHHPSPCYHHLSPGLVPSCIPTSTVILFPSLHTPAIVIFSKHTCNDGTSQLKTPLALLVLRIMTKLLNTVYMDKNGLPLSICPASLPFAPALCFLQPYGTFLCPSYSACSLPPPLPICP